MKPLNNILYFILRIFIWVIIDFQSIQWLECLLNLLANQDYEIVLRGITVAKNLVTVGGEAIAEKVLATEVMEVLQALIMKANRKILLQLYLSLLTNTVLEDDH